MHYALLQTAGIDPDSALLADLKTDEVFPKSEDWINAAVANVLAAKP